MGIFHVNTGNFHINTGKYPVFTRKKYESLVYRFPYFCKIEDFPVFTEIREYESFIKLTNGSTGIRKFYKINDAWLYLVVKWTKFDLHIFLPLYLGLA